MELSPEALATLRFYQDAGVETAESLEPGALWGWTGPSPTKPRKPAAPADTVKPTVKAGAVSASADEALRAAESLAASCQDLDALLAAIAGFEGCPLREAARGPVIYDGVLGADVLVMGEAPGREEDQQGKPFVGRSGQLLDRMLASIGLSRAPSEDQRAVAISNVVYWRPPGNRNPTPAELAVCLPFARRFIALSKPKLVLTAGKVPTEAFFPDASSITRARGKWRTLDAGDGVQVPTLPIFHPAFLLRQPAQKRWAWRDLLSVQSKLNETLS